MDGNFPGGLDGVVEQVQVAYIERDGRVVALVRLIDELGEHRDIEVSERAAWEAMVGFTHFLRQAHRGTPCQGCARSQLDHPNEMCAKWH